MTPNLTGIDAERLAEWKQRRLAARLMSRASRPTSRSADTSRLNESYAKNDDDDEEK